MELLRYVELKEGGHEYLFKINFAVFVYSGCFKYSSPLISGTLKNPSICFRQSEVKPAGMFAQSLIRNGDGQRLIGRLLNLN